MSSMLDYIKTVLQKVSFDKGLFEKELKKGLKLLRIEDVKMLRDWCYEQFSDRYYAVLNQCFTQRLAL